MLTTRSIAETREALSRLPRPLGFVPTMGALHEGHLELMHCAVAECASAVASIFVNPLQFGAGEDFQRYPRDEERDLGLLAARGVAVTFAPPAEEMYPEGSVTSVRVGGRLAETLEGASRPGHFDGVATVVAKLLGIVGPDAMYLGEKDAQQLALVRRMVRDLNLAVSVVGVPTVREADGLAASSRNTYLGPAERRVAPRLFQGLLAGSAAARAGASAAEVTAAATAVIESGSDGLHLVLDYLAAVEPDTFEPVDPPRSGHLLVGAVRLGRVRLIDNLRL